jgi:hypothetical protein
MTVIFDTSQVPPGQREQVVRGALAASAAAMNVHFQCSPDEISYRLQHWQFGKAEMLRCGGFGGLTLGRTARMVREDVHDVITVGFQLQGSGFHAQNGFTRHESPGDLSVLDFTLPWQTGLSQSAVAGTVIFQAEDLGLPVDMVRRAAPCFPAAPSTASFKTTWPGCPRTPTGSPTRGTPRWSAKRPPSWPGLSSPALARTSWAPTTRGTKRWIPG